MWLQRTQWRTVENVKIFLPVMNFGYRLSGGWKAWSFHCCKVFFGSKFASCLQGGCSVYNFYGAQGPKRAVCTQSSEDAHTVLTVVSTHTCRTLATSN